MQCITQENWNEIVKYGANFQELDWFAIDNNGNVGVFSAVMNAPIPEQVKLSFESYLQLKERVDRLQKFSGYELLTSMPGNFSDWINYAEKGLFAFDFQDVHRNIKKGQYDLIAKPVLALNLTDLRLEENVVRCIPKLNCNFFDGDLQLDIFK